MLIAKFELGTVVVTPTVLEKISEIDQMKALNAHANCEWGNVSADDRLANENGLEHGDRLFSVHITTNGCLIWVITEADQSVTTMLMPEDY